MDITYSLTDIDTVSDKLLEAFTSKIVLFKGDLGSGKTTLIKKLVEKLGSTDTVSSPTFSIINLYTLMAKSVFHLDLYRISTKLELFDIGIEDYLYSDNWVFIEWPELIEQNFSIPFNTITIKSVDANNRALLLSY